MADMMTFPDTVEEFMEQYKVVDTDGVYMSKGSELVPIFRMRQWFEHLPSAQPEHIHCKECRWFEPDRHQCGRQICAVFYEDDYCSFAEMKTDGGN